MHTGNERRPALPASKNPRLGRWALPGAGAANGAGLAGQLENLLGGSTRSMLFGTGPIEFRPDTVVNGGGQAAFGQRRRPARRRSGPAPGDRRNCRAKPTWHAWCCRTCRNASWCLEACAPPE
jgi:hypothetical protein